MAVLSPQPLKTLIFLQFFVKVTPPPPPPPPPQEESQEESKYKNVQFLQWILKDDDVYFQKLQHLKFGGILS